MKWHGAEQERVGDREHRGGQTDGDGDHDHGSCARPRAQLPESVPNVAGDVVEDAEARAIAIRLPGRLDATQREKRPPARLGTRHAGPHLIVDMKLQVAVEFVGELHFALSVPRHRADHPQQPGTERAHQGFSWARNRPTIEMVVSQSRVSWPTRFRPARVSA